MDTVNRAMQMGGGYSSIDYGAMQAVSSMFGSMSVLSTLISLLPAMVIVAGIWMVFAAAKRNVLPGLAAVGLTMIRIVVIVQLVFACIALALIEILCIVVMVGVNSVAGYYGDGGSITGIMILGMIIVAAVSAIGIIYYLKLSGTVKRIKGVLATGQTNSQVSLYVEVFCYINGVIAVIGGLGSLVGFSVFGFLSEAGLATANICFAILLRQYRRNMELLITDPQQVYTNLQKKHEQQYQRGVQQPQQPVQQWGQQPQQPAQQWGQQSQQPVQQTGAGYGETEVLPYYSETTVLNGQMINNGVLQLVYLVRQKTRESICINKSEFWFGKEAGHVDYCITDNTAISRRHAVILIRNNECYIRDNYSTNRVFVNGQVLEAGADTPLANGDRIRMGDEEFTVSIG